MGDRAGGEQGVSRVMGEGGGDVWGAARQVACPFTRNNQTCSGSNCTM